MKATRHIMDESQGFEQQLATVLAARLAEDQGVEAAIGWAESVPGELRVHAFRRTAGVVARVDAQRAAAWAHANSGQPHGAGMARMVGVEWARRAAVEEVLAWIDTLPSEAERRDAATTVFRNWHRQAPEAAMSWLQKRNPLERMYRTVIGIHLTQLLKIDPGQAIRWTEGLADPARRDDAKARAGPSLARCG